MKNESTRSRATRKRIRLSRNAARSREWESRADVERAVTSYCAFRCYFFFAARTLITASELELDCSPLPFSSSRDGDDASSFCDYVLMRQQPRPWRLRLLRQPLRQPALPRLRLRRRRQEHRFVSSSHILQ